MLRGTPSALHYPWNIGWIKKSLQHEGQTHPHEMTLDFRYWCGHRLCLLLGDGTWLPDWGGFQHQWHLHKSFSWFRLGSGEQRGGRRLPLRNEIEITWEGKDRAHRDL